MADEQIGKTGFFVLVENSPYLEERLQEMLQKYPILLQEFFEEIQFLGVKPLLLASGLNVIVSQRLVRKLCEHCKRPARLTKQQIANFQRKQIDHSTIMQAAGCKTCRGTGFIGRIAIVDIMRLDEDVKANLANDGLAMGSMKKQGDDKSRSNLKREGLRKVLAGLTTLEEVQRVTSNLG